MANSLTPPLPLTGDTVCTTFSWTPMLGQVGGHVLEFFATDANGCTDGCKMRILATETLLLFGPGPGVSQHTAFGRLYDTQLVSVRRAFPVSTTSGPSPLYSVLPPSYSAQIVRYNAAQYPSQPHRWSRAMTFTKDLPSQAMQAQYFGTENGISLGVQTFTDANGLLRVRFPFSAP